MKTLANKILRFASLACLTLLGTTSANANPGDITTATPNPVPIGGEFEMSVTFQQVTANTPITTKFYWFEASAPVDLVLATVQTPDSGSGTNFSLSAVVTADPYYFRGDRPDIVSRGCGYFFAEARTTQKIWMSDPVLVCVLYESSTTAETVSRLLPVFRASVEPIDPGIDMPTGEIDFYVGATKVCSGEIDESGEAACFSNQLLNLGQHYTARYAGDGVYQPSEDQGSFFP